MELINHCDFIFFFFKVFFPFPHHFRGAYSHSATNLDLSQVKVLVIVIRTLARTIRILARTVKILATANYYLKSRDSLTVLSSTVSMTNILQKRNKMATTNQVNWLGEKINHNN